MTGVNDQYKDKENKTVGPAFACKDSAEEKLGAAFDDLIGATIAFRDALITAQRAATDILALIIGGTGRFRTCHPSKQKQRKPLVDVKCAIPDSLTGANLLRMRTWGLYRSTRRGRTDEAHEGHNPAR